MRITKRKVFYTTTNFNNAIFVNSSIFSVTNLYTLRIHALWINEFVECLTAIMRNIIPHRMNIFEIVNIFMLSSWRAKDFDVCLFTRIRNLGNATAINRIAFHFQNIKSLIHLFLRNTKLSFDTCTDIDHAFFCDLLFKKVSSSFCLIHTSFRTLIQERTNRRIISKAHFVSDFI